MSDTPRTDSQAFCRARAKGWIAPGKDAVSADFARQLERELAQATKERNEKQAALVELIKAAKCAMNAIAMSDTCIIRFEAALQEAGIDDGFGVRAQKAAGL